MYYRHHITYWREGKTLRWYASNKMCGTLPTAFLARNSIDAIFKALGFHNYHLREIPCH